MRTTVQDREGHRRDDLPSCCALIAQGMHLIASTDGNVRGYRPPLCSPYRMAEHELKVLDRRKRIVEVMQQALPFLVGRRLAKSHGVILKRFPPHQKHVAGRYFNTALQLMRSIAGHRRNDRRRLAERVLKCITHAGLNIQECDFQNHVLSSHRNSRISAFHRAPGSRRSVGATTNHDRLAEATDDDSKG